VRKKPQARKKPGKRSAPAQTGKPQSDRVTYRDLRNTPGRVWERLANDELLTLVADGQAKAVVIPVNEGNARSVIEAYRRGLAMMAIAAIRRAARDNGTSRMTIADINAVIRETRNARNRAQGSR
jgi:hypothetical protein